MLGLLIGGLGVCVGIAALNPPLLLLALLAGFGAGLVLIIGGGTAIAALLGTPQITANGLLVVDSPGGFFLFILAIVGGTVLINLWGDLQNRRASGESPRRVSLHLCFTFAFLQAMILSISTQNMGIIWVAVEGTTLISAMLIGFDTHRAALEAAWKYVVLCTVALACSLFGLILLLHASQLAHVEGTLDVLALTNAAPHMPVPLLKLAFVMILIGFAAKAGFAPLHSWLPDAYSQAPAPTSALLSGVLFNSSLLALLRMEPIMEAAGLGGFFHETMIIFGLLSLLIAALFLLVQQDIMRMLAYSSIENIGLITLGFGLGSPLAVFAALLHALGHSLSKALAFLSAGELVHFFHSHEMNRMIGVMKRIPIGGGGFTVAIMALGGMPPFPLFISELLLISAAFSLNQYIVGVMILGGCSVAFCGLLYHSCRIILGEDAIHHHHIKDEAHDHPHEQETAIIDVVNDAHVAIGREWRHLALYMLTTFLILFPVILFPPFSGILDTVVMSISGGLR
ncbi:MAG: hydrogenase 4 subunit F [Candidatus Riflebacteria bacterium]|nr:hydrogenase 4 subunit F [Candidatus Riflebacteria bacterium]